MMQLFYAPGFSGTTISLDEKESRHCIKVLRLKKNSPLFLTDGRGNLIEGIINDPDPSACIVDVKNVISNFGKKNYRLHIGISILKNPERFEWFAEKCVEIGVDIITPLICEKTEKKTLKEERVRGIIISAMKQSVKTELPVLAKVITLDDFLGRKDSNLKLIAHCSELYQRIPLKSAYIPGTDTTILVGPEGDFTHNEISLAEKAGYKSISLGNSRLRSETAGIAACHSINLLNQQD